MSLLGGHETEPFGAWRDRCGGHLLQSEPQPVPGDSPAGGRILLLRDRLMDDVSFASLAAELLAAADVCTLGQRSWIILDGLFLMGLTGHRPLC